MSHIILNTLRLTVVLSIVLITGCQSAQFIESSSATIDTDAVLYDDAFPTADSYVIETPESLFRLSQAAKDFVNSAVSGRDSDEKQVKKLMADIFNRSEYDLLYQANANTNATETFENRAANCLSLTIMTYAMASHAGFNARFQQIDIPEFWTRRGGFALLNGHINLRIVPKYTVSSFQLFRRDLIIDFDPQEGVYEFIADEISRARIVAMFYNNKAAELILKGELNHAYAYLRAALLHDAGYAGAVLNLGLVYRQAGELAYAEQAYLASLKLNENYLTAWENLAALYEKTDREAQSKEIYTRLKKQRMSNPYYHLMLAEAALEKNNFVQSISHFKDAIALNDSPHQFYFGLAQAYFKMDDLENTQRYLRVAKRKAGRARISEDYNKKISILANLQKQKNQS